MTIRLRLFFLMLAFSGPALLLQAQPDATELHFDGCHFYKSKIPVQALLDAEKDANCGSNARSDSLDILNYEVTLNLTQFTQKTLNGRCEITFTAKQPGIQNLPLDLLNLTVDSVTWQNTNLAYDYDGLLLFVHLAEAVSPGDTAAVVVYYHGTPSFDPSGFGGFVFENGLAYNLGIGLNSNPYNFGRSWHPCFDNFVERATYDLNLITNNGRKGYGIGQFLGETDLGGGEALRQFRMDLPLPTYLVGVAAGPYREVHEPHTGIYGERPILLVGQAGDTTKMKTAFTYLPDAVDAFESWFGPYIWGNVGYVMTTNGAMEHASLIAYPDFVIDGGANDGMNGLMAHELGHQWWGNVTTLSCPDNMWIKEGNAEYSSHLFYEYTFGKKKFENVVKANHYKVLRTAHLDDGAYLPLSGLPYENTYGTTTYNKGASVMHNLRGYLGDTLFQQGMKSILDTYKFESVDAELFRDQLTANTGLDMTSFFDDWIYSPGFATYEIDSVKTEPGTLPETWIVTVNVQQKLRAAPHFHTNVPLEITFYDENWQSHTATIIASGEFSEAVLSVPFKPVWQILNESNRLNLASMQDWAVVKSTGTVTLNYCEILSMQAQAVTDSALVSLTHYWAPPDPATGQPDVQLSSTHYWRYGGLLPLDFRARITLPFKGTSVNDFDYDLAQVEDTIRLVWRPKPGVDWGHYPFYTVLGNGSLSNSGFIRVDTLLPGDYAFAKGALPLATGVAGVEMAAARWNIFPNPAAEAGFTVQGVLPGRQQEVDISLTSLTGRLLKKMAVPAHEGQFSHHLTLSGLPAGLYFVTLQTPDGHLRQVKKVVKK